jgi:hypothetical protein
MGNKLCSFEGCQKKHCAKGLCNSHWAQKKRHGELTPIVTHESLHDRFLRQTKIPENKNECWIFEGNGEGSGKSAKQGCGYGQIWFNNKKQMAHRYSYEYYKEKIPAGIQIDHMCRVKKCVNPAHLQLVTQDENMRRLHFARSLEDRLKRLEDFIQKLGYDPKII